MKAPVFTGSGVAIVTPMLPDRTINFEKLDELIEFQLQNGTDSIVICGTTGETPTLTEQEHLEAISHAVKTVGGRCPVIAGTGSNSTAHCVALSQAAEQSGADAVLVVTPYYNKASRRGLVAHYTAVADTVNVPVIIYNVPSRTGVSMTVEAYRELSAHPRINGVKEASGDVALAARTIAACGDSFNVWSGNDDQIVPLMSVGACGVISVLANLMPKETAHTAHLCLEDRFLEAGREQVRLMDMIDALFCEVNPIPVKTALNLIGFNAGPLRLPLCDMAPENLERLKAALRRFGFRV